jgi:hypothetical protein
LGEPEVHLVMLLRVKTLQAVLAQLETATLTGPVVVARAREAPEVTHRLLEQLPQERMLAPEVKELHQQSPEHRFVTQPVVVVVFTGMVATLAPVVLALRQTQRLVALVEKVA